MKLDKSFVFGHFKKELAAKYGPKKAAAIWRYAEDVLRKLEADEPDADKNSRSFVFPAVALYRAVGRYAPGEALTVTRAYGRKTGIRMRNIFMKVTALPGIPTLMWKNMDKIAAIMSSGYECRDVIVTDHLCSLDVTGCPLYDKAKALGTPEAVQMICCMDKEYMTGFRGVKYTRTKSVAEGDDCCDYRLRDARRKGSLVRVFKRRMQNENGQDEIITGGQCSMSKTITTSVPTEGFEAILYPGNGRKDKVMIVMSGSNGGMALTRQEAEFYHSNGIPALALALFRTKQTPKDLSRVPVEFVERAILWLKKQGYKQIGIDGTSKGSEMALVAASLFPELSCVIARVPSHFVSEGLAGSGKNRAPSGTSCWSYRGKELPYAPYRSRTFNLLQLLMREKELHIITFNRDKDITPDTLIPIENIKAPILLLSSKHDEVWPSYESSVYMEKKLNEIRFPYPHKHIAYNHMSHAAITRLPWIYKLAFKSERRHPEECAKDRKALKKELLNWVNSDWQYSNGEG